MTTKSQSSVNPSDVVFAALVQNLQRDDTLVAKDAVKTL
jgi:hypothetical protein